MVDGVFLGVGGAYADAYGGFGIGVPQMADGFPDLIQEGNEIGEGHLCADEDEFVTAHADEMGLSQVIDVVMNRIGNGFQYFIAEVVAEAGVEIPEVVDVNEGQG